MLINSLYLFDMISRRYILIFLTIILLFTQAGCKALKPKKVSAKDFPADPRERVKRNIEEGKGFRVFGGNNKGTSYEFASSNPLWRATLETLDFMPLASANYSGGIVITDWYSENNSPNESVKISVRFLTNEIRSDALDIDLYIKKCSQNLTGCSVSKSNGDLVADLNLSILKKATMYQKKLLEKRRKENPYIMGDMEHGGNKKDKKSD
ncbi:DUF3576 domain-containing protein [Candidatus Pelagibacter sp.]|nr:DUF3576 domain-containing protein [Candidatus Pelagibacter sp.]